MSEALLVHDLTIAAADAAIETIILKAKLHPDQQIQDMILVCALATLSARHRVFMDNSAIKPIVDAANSMFGYIYKQELERLQQLTSKGQKI